MGVGSRSWAWPLSGKVPREPCLVSLVREMGGRVPPAGSRCGSPGESPALVREQGVRAGGGTAPPERPPKPRTRLCTCGRTAAWSRIARAGGTGGHAKPRGGIRGARSVRRGRPERFGSLDPAATPRPVGSQDGLQVQSQAGQKLFDGPSVRKRGPRHQEAHPRADTLVPFRHGSPKPTQHPSAHGASLPGNGGLGLGKQVDFFLDTAEVQEVCR